jgi:uncharacterized protein YkwD
MRLRPTRAVLGLLALVVIALSAACTAPSEQQAFDAINGVRSAAHVPGLAWNDAVHQKAVDWSNHMADQGTLSHSVLSDGVPSGWRTIGENVAYADTIDRAVATLEASAPHRANMINPAFTSAAIGVVERNGLVWVTEVFVG